MTPTEIEHETLFSESLGSDLSDVLAELGEIVFSPGSEDPAEVEKRNEAFIKLLDRLKELVETN